MRALLASSFLNKVLQSKRLERKKWEGKFIALVVSNWLLANQFYTPIGKYLRLFLASIRVNKRYVNINYHMSN